MKDWLRGPVPPLAAAAGILIVILGLVFLLPLGKEAGKPERARDVASDWPADPFPTTYKPLAAPPTLIRNATILTGTGEEIATGSVLMENGKISEVGRDVGVPAGATVIDARGKFVTPGIIDMHSHLGVYPTPSIASTSDGNEATKPSTPEVRAEHSVWPQDTGFTRALAGGVTAMQVLPGSANLIGGRSVVLKNIWARTVQEMKFPGAPYGLKMACGENPKRVYGEKSGPSTRMGNVAGYRAAFAKAAEYERKWKKYWGEKNAGKDADPPDRDFGLETLAQVLEKEIWVQMHCYRGDEMAFMMDIAKEFGFKIAAFHHAIEAYKVADLLRVNDICAVTWADWWGFKLEAYDGIQENIALVEAAGACVTIHSDSEVFVQRLNQEVALAMAVGRKMGLDITRARAVRWMTSNPAKALNILDKVGTIEKGKMADVVLWSRDPFSVYAHAEKVWLDGWLAYDRSNPKRSPHSDFELGQLGAAATGGAGQ
ncbi:MAG: amidohydrolase [Alphaproteobacteria bacterium]